MTTDDVRRRLQRTPHPPATFDQLTGLPVPVVWPYEEHLSHPGLFVPQDELVVLLNTAIHQVRLERAHQWEDGPYPSRFTVMMGGSRVRTCAKCKATQTEHRDYQWGRLCGRRWLPLARRCKPV